MGSRVTYYLLLLLNSFALSIFPGCSVTERLATIHTRQLLHKTSISTNRKDITTPVTTVPTIPTSPVINPNSDPDWVSPSTMTPMVTPSSPVSPGASWCVASQSAPPKALQVALDYSCGYGGADCSAIQPGGSCYNPNSLRDHSSFAFNNYYQKNPIPSSCNFGGTAVTTSTDPSTGACRYPSTSTSSSILNITNSNGATVFGGVPATPSTPSAAAAAKIYNTIPPCFMSIAFLSLFFAN